MRPPAGTMPAALCDTGKSYWLRLRVCSSPQYKTTANRMNGMQIATDPTIASMDMTLLPRFGFGLEGEGYEAIGLERFDLGQTVKSSGRPTIRSMARPPGPCRRTSRRRLQTGDAQDRMPSSIR
jgi:hypothetical protein